LPGKPQFGLGNLFDSQYIGKNSRKIYKETILREPGVTPQEKLNPRKYNEKIKESNR